MSNVALRRRLLELADIAVKSRDESGVMALLAIPGVVEQLLTELCSEKVRVYVSIGDDEVERSGGED